ncbi:MAG: hypothetical protein EHM45_16205 [Desulfobacteraceae bacterium]|nr:MAG: hypothetical protein EHM45_16205 [Desulfobacteraceae bacterium]
MTLKNQYLLAALCCTIGCVFMFAGRESDEIIFKFAPVLIVLALIFPRLKRLTNPIKEKKFRTGRIKQVTLVNLLLLLLILWIFGFTLYRKLDPRVLFAHYGYLALLWLFFMTYMYKCYLLEEVEMKEKEDSPKQN